MSIKTQRILTRAKKLVKKGSIEEAKKLYSMILKGSSQNHEAKLGLLALKDLKDNQEPPQANIQSIVALYSNNQIQEALVDIETLVIHQYSIIFELPVIKRMVKWMPLLMTMKRQ